MNSISTKAIVAVMATAIGLGAIAPVMAQSAPPAPETAVTQDANGPAHGVRSQGDGPRQRGGFGGFFDFGRGGEGIEVALVQLSHRIELSADQQTLLEALKTSALAAADDFAAATEGLRPAEGEKPAMPSVATMLENRIAIETAHVAALEAVQPAVVAFFDSLTDAQKAELAPQTGEHGPRGPRGLGGNSHR